MPFRRILVCEAPYRAHERERGRRIPCEVGVLPWTQGRPWLGVFVRTAWSFAFRSSTALSSSASP